MPDLLVSLYNDRLSDLENRTRSVDIIIRPVLAPEMQLVVGWVGENFSQNWASEVSVAITRQPATCLLAVVDGKLVGFACYDATARGFFGPTGVHIDSRGKGIGAALLSASLHAMKSAGYAYAIIGDAGPIDFYADAVGAIPIAAPDKGIYEGMLRAKRH